MKRVQQTEPPSLFRPPVFMIGQDHRGNWVVQDQKRMAGGLFATRDAALRYVRSESGYLPRAVVMVSGNFELDMSRCGAARASRQTAAVDMQRSRHIA
jgi:hypothetical protein